jgi:hypothetical protein
MMPYQAYQAYDAARPRTVAQRREADARLGQISATMSELWSEATRPVRAVRSLFHQGKDDWAGSERSTPRAAQPYPVR